MTERMESLGVAVNEVSRPQWISTSFYWRGRKLLNPFALLYDLTVIPRYAWRIRKALRDQKIHVLHSSGMVAQIAGGLAARFAGIPHVAQVQDIIGNPVFQRIYAILLNRLADRVVGISHAVATPFDPAKTHVIFNVADPVRAKIPLKTPLPPLTEGTHRIGMVGRLVPWKGQRVFLEAAVLLLKQSNAYQFVIVGDDQVGGVGGYRSELERYVADQGIIESIHFLGARPDSLAILRACTIAVHASLKPEPFGIVIVEAMLAGTAVIATRGGGTSDIITDSVDGRLIESGDPNLLAETIRSLIADLEGRAKMVEAAHHKAQTTFAPETMVNAFAALYEELRTQKSTAL
jgi:glycosyltransferase involved in cell wall biosynthesis